MQQLKPVKLCDILVTDAAWRKYIDLVPNVMLPHQWEILNDRVDGAEPSHCIRNYRIAAGEEAGRHAGTVFLDTDLSKWLEAVAYSLETRPDPALERDADDVIDLIGRVQQSDGYINTYYTLAEPGRRWTNLTEGHELYNAGHLIEAAVAYFEATGKDTILRIASRFADLLCRTFGHGDGQIHGYPGHPEVELALVRLFRATSERRYLDLALYFIDERGKAPNYFFEEMKQDGHRFIFDELKDYDPVYSQSHMPPRLQRKAEGHAVRATYLYCAMAELAAEYDDTELMTACEAIWKNMTERRMYLTGSIGSSSVLERFTADYDLPNGENYSETCAAIGLIRFGAAMARIKRDATYYDAVERALYNTVLGGVALDGGTYFYVNPLEVWPQRCMAHTAMAHVKPVRQKWFNVACCPTNIARTLASLGKYIYSAGEDGLYLNLFISSAASFDIHGRRIKTQLSASFPDQGAMRLTVETPEPVEFAVNVRIPGYVKHFSIHVDGVEVSPTIENGYARIIRTWDGRMSIDVLFDICAEFVAAHPEVRADAGKIALVKGPIVYCLEEVDNGANLASVAVSPDAALEEQFEPDLLGGVTVIRFPGKRIVQDRGSNALYRPVDFRTEAVTLKAIPYSRWGNRGENEMAVWICAHI